MHSSCMFVPYSSIRRTYKFVEFTNDIEISIHKYYRDLYHPAVGTTMLNINMNIDNPLANNILMRNRIYIPSLSRFWWLLRCFRNTGLYIVQHIVVFLIFRIYGG